MRDALVKLLKKRYPGLQFDASGAPQYMIGMPAWLDSLGNLEEHLERIGEVCLVVELFSVVMRDSTSSSMSMVVVRALL